VPNSAPSRRSASQHFQALAGSAVNAGVSSPPRGSSQHPRQIARSSSVYRWSPSRRASPLSSDRLRLGVAHCHRPRRPARTAQVSSHRAGSPHPGGEQNRPFPRRAAASSLTLSIARSRSTPHRPRPGARAHVLPAQQEPHEIPRLTGSTSRRNRSLEYGMILDAAAALRTPRRLGRGDRPRAPKPSSHLGTTSH